mmetsp:Transcript_30922/g.48471  ORF Transcript_30922/g.48471 Transcript_30922/m.48471 type:complete len:238 (+) Transcript_30922:59-772(+)|eukprot:CAMPEP_0184300246 /NCGR_PEP_ID=MMETSP1049-20130417/10696_1 /TAXON_ID=77928 /ORGANISM="Proteomonas sulcata, Strain CCMP704" /LENGTH=237 /DNA_ID=CAMNT_0026610911 /DNA_START=49 /DNA_END=762 /DNA_ORIENTATION=+
MSWVELVQRIQLSGGAPDSAMIQQDLAETRRAIAVEMDLASSYQQELESFQKQIDESRSRIAAKQAPIEPEGVRQVSELQHRVAELERDIHSLRDTEKHQNAEISQLRRARMDLEMTTKSVHNSVELLGAQAGDQDDQVEQLMAEFRVLAPNEEQNRALLQLKASLPKGMRLEDYKQILEGELTALQSESLELKQSIEDGQQQASDFTHAISLIIKKMKADALERAGQNNMSVFFVD